MCSEKQLLANRANAQKSTGPRSHLGKLAVSQNAARHGLRGSADVLMPDEDPQPFEELRAQLQRDLDPHGPMERLLVDRIVTGAWRLRRAHWIEQGVFERDAGNPCERDITYGDLLHRRFVYACESADALGKLARYENAIDRGMARALCELQRLQSARRGEEGSRDEQCPPPRHSHILENVGMSLEHPKAENSSSETSGAQSALAVCDPGDTRGSGEELAEQSQIRSQPSAA